MLGVTKLNLKLDAERNRQKNYCGLMRLCDYSKDHGSKYNCVQPALPSNYLKCFT